MMKDVVLVVLKNKLGLFLRYTSCQHRCLTQMFCGSKNGISLILVDVLIGLRFVSLWTAEFRGWAVFERRCF